MFKNNVLVHCSNENPLVSVAGIKQAWAKFFKNPPEIMKNKCEKICLKIKEYKEIGSRKTDEEYNHFQGSMVLREISKIVLETVNHHS